MAIDVIREDFLVLRLSCPVRKGRWGKKRFFSNLLRSRERSLSPSYDYAKRTSDCDERRVRYLILTDFVQERYVIYDSWLLPLV